MNKVDLIKGIAGIVTGAGVGKTVDIILKNNLPIEMNWKTRLATIIGSAAISGYISAKCGDYVENEIDKVVEIVDNVKDARQKMATNIVINNTINEEVTPDDISVEMTD